MGAAGRVAVTVVGYAVFTALLVSAGSWLGRVLALPPLFDRLGLGALALGFPLALYLAWKLPEIGEPAGAAGARGGSEDGPGPRDV